MRYVFQNRGGSPYSWRAGPPAAMTRAADSRSLGDYVFRPGAPEVLTGDPVSVPVSAIAVVAAAYLLGTWLSKA